MKNKYPQEQSKIERSTEQDSGVKGTDNSESYTTVPMTTPRALTEEVFKEMWMLRYQQYMGQITFLQLLDKYEEILGIKKTPLSQKRGTQ